MRAFVCFFLIGCSPVPTAHLGKWAGDDLPLNIDLGMPVSLVARAELVLTKKDATLTATLSTATEIPLGTLEVSAPYTLDASTEPERMTLTIDSMVLTAATGELIEATATANGTLLCLPLGEVEACVPSTQTVELSVDGDTLRIFVNPEDQVKIAVPMTRV